MSFSETMQSIGGVVSGLFQHTEENIHRFFTRVERRVIRRGLALKRFIAVSAIEIFILLFGLACFLVGLIILLARIARLDFVLIVIGIILMNIVLITAKFR